MKDHCHDHSLSDTFQKKIQFSINSFFNISIQQNSFHSSEKSKKVKRCQQQLDKVRMKKGRSLMFEIETEKKKTTQKSQVQFRMSKKQHFFYIKRNLS